MTPGSDISEGMSRRAFALLFLGLTCSGINVSIAYSVLPPVLRALHLPDIAFAVITGATTLIWTFTAPFWGRYSDNRGQRPVLLIGFIGWSISSLFLGLVIELGMAGVLTAVISLGLMAGARAVIGLLSSGTFPAANAYVAARTSRRDRAPAMATLSAAHGLGAMLGPGIGALLFTFGYAVPFYLTAAIAAVAAIGIGLYLPETRLSAEEQERRAQRPALRLLDPRLQIYLILSAASSLVQAGVMTTFGFYVMDSMKVAPERATFVVGLAMTVRAVALMVTQFAVIGPFRPSPRAMIVLGVVLTGAAFIPLLFTNSYSVALASMVVLGAGFAFLQPGTSAAASLAVNRDEQGAAAGLVGSAGISVYMVVPFIALPLYHLDPELPYILNILAMAGALALVLRQKSLGRIESEPGATAMPPAVAVLPIAVETRDTPPSEDPRP